LHYIDFKKKKLPEKVSLGEEVIDLEPTALSLQYKVRLVNYSLLDNVTVNKEADRHLILIGICKFGPHRVIFENNFFIEAIYYDKNDVEYLRVSAGKNQCVDKY
jgi:hypothetical protein